MNIDREHLDEDVWNCPGCHRNIQPSDVRRHAQDCDKYDGRYGY